LVWACTENGRKQNSQKSIVYEYGKTRPRGILRNRWQDEVREDGTYGWWRTESMNE
jgi:hypothetical protein